MTGWPGSAPRWADFSGDRLQRLAQRPAAAGIATDPVATNLSAALEATATTAAGFIPFP